MMVGEKEINMQMFPELLSSWKFKTHQLTMKKMKKSI